MFLFIYNGLGGKRYYSFVIIPGILFNFKYAPYQNECEKVSELITAFPGVCGILEWDILSTKEGSTLDCNPFHYGLKGTIFIILQTFSMKRARFLLAAIAVMAIVGGLLAFRASRLSVSFCRMGHPGVCTTLYLNSSFIPTTTGTTYCTWALGAPCTQRVTFVP